MKKRVDERDCIWYYSQAPYERHNDRSETEVERKSDRTLKIKQRKELRNP